MIDLTLCQAEKIALEQNKDLQIMRQLLERARQGRLESLSKWLPELTLVSRGYAAQKKVQATGTRSAFISQFGLTQALFSTDRYYNVKISSLQVEQLSLLLNALILDVLFDVRVAYYRVILDQENSATAEKNVEIFTALAERMESNYEIGTSILLNVNQSKVAIANATKAYYQAVRQLEVDLDHFVRLLGFTPGTVEVTLAESEIPIYTIPDIAEKVETVEAIFKQADLDGALYKLGFPETEESLMSELFSTAEMRLWQSLALEFRPDLRSKFTEVEIANQEVKKGWGEYFPSVSLEANYGGYPERMFDSPSSSFFNQKFSGAVGFTLDWMLFDGCGREYRINQARLTRNAKQIEYGKGVQMTVEEVRKQIFEMRESVSNYVTAEGNVKLASQTLDLAGKQLLIGTITVFDYQMVVDGLIQALNLKHQARYDLISSYYGLRHVSGIDLACR